MNTDLLILRRLQGDRGRIIKQSSVCIPAKRNVLSWQSEVLVDCSRVSLVDSLFHARRAATDCNRRQQNTVR